jgi:O-antigen biosynthesis protein
VLAVYSLLPESLRFSRGIILFGSVMAFLLVSVFRKLLITWNIIETAEGLFNSRVLLVCGENEREASGKLLKETGRDQQIFGRVSVAGKENHAIGSLNQLPQLVKAIPVKEIIFCEGELSFHTIIEQVQLLPQTVRYKFHAKNSSSMVGSDSKDEAGDYLAMEKTFVLAQAVSRRNKRVWDMAYALNKLPGSFYHTKKTDGFFW